MQNVLKKVSSVKKQSCLSAFFQIIFVGFMLFKPGIASGNLFRFQANEPLQGFFSPFFNEQGVKVWQCQGSQVKYISDAKIKIQKMYITFFCPGQNQEVDMVVRSDKAVISLQTQQAFGKTLLTVTHPTYTILGENWQWDGKHSGQAFSKIYIGKNASAMFYD